MGGTIKSMGLYIGSEREGYCRGNENTGVLGVFCGGDWVRKERDGSWDDYLQTRIG